MLGFLLGPCHLFGCDLSLTRLLRVCLFAIIYSNTRQLYRIDIASSIGGRFLTGTLSLARIRFVTCTSGWTESRGGSYWELRPRVGRRVGALSLRLGHSWRDKWTALSGPLSRHKWPTLTPRGALNSEKPCLASRPEGLISQKVLIKSFCKSQIPQLILEMINDNG